MIHFAYDKPNFPVEIINSPPQTIIKFRVAWDPPSVTDLTAWVESKEVKFIRMAWTEPEIWGYGWWQRTRNHTEKHVFGVNGEVGLDEYKRFLEEEGF